MEHSGLNFRLKRSLPEKKGLPFRTFRLSRKFSAETTQKVVFYLLFKRIFWKLFVNGKWP